MAKLTKKEQAVLDVLTSRIGKTFTADQIAAELWEDDDRPEHWRHGLLFTLRILSAKTEFARVRVVRTTKLGRGHCAGYAAERAKNKTTPQKGTSLKSLAVV